MATAYVLLNTELGAETEVMKGMKMIVEIKEARALPSIISYLVYLPSIHY